MAVQRGDAGQYRMVVLGSTEGDAGQYLTVMLGSTEGVALGSTEGRR
jgi:hypothetical protein